MRNIFINLSVCRLFKHPDLDKVKFYFKKFRKKKTNFGFLKNTKKILFLSENFKVAASSTESGREKK